MPIPPKNKNKKYNNKPSIRQKKAIKILLEKGGSVGDAMRQAGYSEATIKNPKHLTDSKAYKTVLEKAGLDDNLLAKTHLQQIRSARIETLNFRAIKELVSVTHSPKSGRKLKKPQEKIIYNQVPDEVIKAQIESVPGHKLLYILKGLNVKRAYFQVPENTVIAKALEMGYKVKGHFSAEKLEVTSHELSDSEREALSDIIDT